MNPFSKILFIFSTLIFLSNCAIQNLEDYSNEIPKLELENYFAGKTIGYGLVQERSGKVLKRFIVEIDGTFSGEKGVLDERFKWSNGENEQRIWTLKKISSNKWSGSAEDVVGEAHGEISGNSLKWSYTLKLELDNGSINVKFDDWMYMIDNKVLMNRAKFKKFGIALGEVTITFIKPDLI